VAIYGTQYTEKLSKLSKHGHPFERRPSTFANEI